MNSTKCVVDYTVSQQTKREAISINARQVFENDENLNDVELCTWIRDEAEILIRGAITKSAFNGMYADGNKPTITINKVTRL